VNCRIPTVAMESTGVYWTPLYDVLEQYGIKPCLVDARNRKNVPGRRTDWHECQWLQYLHSVGLLRAALISDITGLTGLSIVASWMGNAIQWNWRNYEIRRSGQVKRRYGNR
jgi:hypothetical protein